MNPSLAQVQSPPSQTTTIKTEWLKELTKKAAKAENFSDQVNNLIAENAALRENIKTLTNEKAALETAKAKTEAEKAKVDAERKELATKWKFAKIIGGLLCVLIVALVVIMIRR